MKFAWRSDIVDWASWNTTAVEEVDEMREYADYMAADEEQQAWDREEDDIVSFSE